MNYRIKNLKISKNVSKNELYNIFLSIFDVLTKNIRRDSKPSSPASSVNQENNNIWSKGWNLVEKSTLYHYNNRIIEIKTIE